MTDHSREGDPFAALAQVYDSWFDTPLGDYIDREELGALDLLLPPPGEGVVVEVGAGTGHVARHLSGRGYRMLALEPSSAMRNAGRRRPAIAGFDWCAATGELLPLGSAAADGVLFFATLEFVHDREAVLREAMRVARPGGWVAAAVLHALSPWTALYRYAADAGELPWRAARFFTPDALTAVLGPPAATAEAVYLSPGAVPPYAEANDAGKRAGNAPALHLSLWRKQG